MGRKERAAYIDYFRCFGILFMIMGHIGFGDKFDVFVHAFHMPMFFFSSGMLFAPLHINGERGGIGIQYLKVVKRKTKSLLVPYCFVGAIHYVIWLTANYHYEDNLLPLLHLLSDNTAGLPYAGALWFLTAFYFAQLIYYAVDTFINKGIAKDAVIIFLSVMGYFAGDRIPVKLPWALGAALVGLGFLHAGRVFSRWALKMPFYKAYKYRRFIIIVCGFVIAAAISFNGSVNMRTGVYGCIPLYWVNATGASILGVSIAKDISQHIECKGYKKIDKYIRTIGEDSIVYLGFNQIVIFSLNKIFLGIEIGQIGTGRLYIIVRHLLLLLCTLAILHFFSYSLFKFRATRYLMGREATGVKRFFTK